MTQGGDDQDWKDDDTRLPEQPEAQPVQDYCSPDPGVMSRSEVRRKRPSGVGLGFTVTAAVLAVSWLALSERMVPHIALYLSGAVAVAAVALVATRQSRRVRIGCILAIGVWLLMLGLCSRTGTVSPYAF